MARIVFPKGKQQQFLEKVKEISGLRWEEVGKLIGVCGRTMRDWRREKFLANKEKIDKLAALFKIKVPKPIEIKEEFWSAKKYASLGAKRRYQLYGPPGNRESRRKGGLVSQQRRRENPEYYRKLGCNVRNEFRFPRQSVKLAEFIGIVLGDGNIGSHHISIYQGKENKEYVYFIQRLINGLFKYEAKIHNYKNIFLILCSGVNLVEFLERIGLKRGNKIKNQVDMPQWIKENLQFRKACIRGLFDTDGGIYFHKHVSKGIKYCNLGFCFTSYSKPLLKSFGKTLKILGYNIHEIKERRIYIYEFKEIKRYFGEIGTHNPKHLNRLKKYLNNFRRSRIVD